MTVSAIQKDSLEEASLNTLVEGYLDATVEKTARTDETAVIAILAEVVRRDARDAFNYGLQLFNEVRPRYALDALVQKSGVTDLARAIYLDELGWTEEDRAEEIWIHGSDSFGESDAAYRFQGVINSFAAIGETFAEHPVLGTVAALVLGAPLAVGIALEIPACVIGGAVLMGATALYGVAGAMVHEIKAALSESREERVTHLLAAGHSMGTFVQSIPIGAGIIRSVEKSARLLVETSRSVSEGMRNTFKTGNVLKRMALTPEADPFPQLSSPVVCEELSPAPAVATPQHSPQPVVLPDGFDDVTTPTSITLPSVQNPILPKRAPDGVTGGVPQEIIPPEAFSAPEKVLERLGDETIVPNVVDIFALLRAKVTVERIGAALAQVSPSRLMTIYTLFFRTSRTFEQEKTFANVMGAALSEMPIEKACAIVQGISQSEDSIYPALLLRVIAETLMRLPIAEGERLIQQLGHTGMDPSVFREAFEFLREGERALLQGAVPTSIETPKRIIVDANSPADRLWELGME